MLATGGGQLLLLGIGVAGLRVLGDRLMGQLLDKINALSTTAKYIQCRIMHIRWQPCARA